VLFLCTGNSARSLLAECLLERLGQGRFRAFSAGSHPKPAPHPHALALLRERGFATARLRSKSWDEFAGDAAPPIDLVVTVCDAAAGEACPHFPGAPARLHWSIDDPAAARGSEAEIRAAFRRAYDALEARVEALVKERA
jgi:arsenate reductase